MEIYRNLSLEEKIMSKNYANFSRTTISLIKNNKRWRCK